jgi:hypothetical protein
MMIRIKAGETAITKGRSSKGTIVMELRDKAKGGYSDSIIFTARLPADLVDDDDMDNVEAGMEAPEGIIAADSEEE